MIKIKLGLLRLATVVRVVISEQNSSTSSLLLYPNCVKKLGGSLVKILPNEIEE